MIHSPESTGATGIPKVLGLIAGEGDFPVMLAHGARGEGVDLVIFGVNGLASDKLSGLTDKFYTLKLTEMTKLFDLCRRHSVRHLVMAGRVPHKVLLRQISLDPRILKILSTLRNKKADSLLRAATDEIEREGIQVLDSTMFLKWCMPEPGLLTARRPLSEDVRRDIEFGYPIAKEIARLDVGQTIAVKNQIVVAVEGIEGTDELIRRAGALAGPGVVIVKASKPRQDMRFDVPVVGITTIRNMVEIKAGGLAMTARQPIFLDREEAVAVAERAGISLFAWEETGRETPY
jgi:DUF1009 family protein